jgi:hypothetical protein
MDIDYDTPNWGPFLMKTQVTNEFCDEMLVRAEKCKLSWNHQLAGHLDSQLKFDDTDKRFFFDTLYTYFDKYIEEELKWFSLDVPKKGSIGLKPMSLWVNFMNPGDFNPPHFHDGDYSFVLYIDIPKELEIECKNYKGRGGNPGSILFRTPGSPGLSLNNFKSLTQHNYTPKKRDFFIFSAHTEHMVYPYKSDCQRVSISGNLTLLSEGNIF